MRPFIHLSLLTGATLATHLAQGPQNADSSTVTVVWEKDLLSGDLATSAWGAGKVLLGYSCSNDITVGGQDYMFHVERGAGKIQVGTIQADPEVRAGCSRQFNDEYSITECIIPVPVRLATATTDELSREEILLKCFSNSKRAQHGYFSPWRPLGTTFHEGVEYLDSHENAQSTLVEDFNTTDASALPTRLGRRQRCQELTRNVEINHPNRDPRKWSFHSQLTPYHHCGSAPTCGIAYTRQGTIQHQASVASGVPWFSGGYAVAYSQTTGWEASCGQEANKGVCIWGWRQFQEYNMRYQVVNSCGTVLSTRDARLRSPMSARRHFGTYCVTNQACRGEGDGYWADDGAGTW
ncbi:hypothetical protein V8F20_007270 [Naviculisporaceae sp. PSN 640]